METLAQSKFFIALGGFLGFTLTFASGILAGGHASDVLRDATIGCLICGLLVKMLMSVIHSNLQTAMQQRIRKKMGEQQSDENEDELTDDEF